MAVAFPPSLSQAPSASSRLAVPVRLCLVLLCLAAGCAADASGTGDPFKVDVNADVGWQGGADPDAGGAGAYDAAAGGWQNGSGPSGGAASEAGTPNEPDVGEPIPPEQGLRDAAFVEEKGSLVLEQPAALAGVFSALLGDTGSARLFLNSIHQGAGYQVRYGAAEMANEGVAVWQEPEVQNVFSITAVEGDARSYASAPFEFALRATIPIPLIGGEVGVRLFATNAQWTAQFSADYARIERGSVTGLMPRAQAEATSLGSDVCLLACPLAACWGGVSVSTLAQVLDCNGQAVDADADGDGVLDAYTLRIRFRSERVALGMQ